jgi:hypothetical protein
VKLSNDKLGRITVALAYQVERYQEYAKRDVTEMRDYWVGQANNSESLRVEILEWLASDDNQNA